MENTNTIIPKKAGSNVWIGVGYMFAVLGGIIGIIIGYNFRSKNYNEQTRRHGLYIIILGTTIMILGRGMLRGNR